MAVPMRARVSEPLKYEATPRIPRASLAIVLALDCSHIDDHLFVLGHMVPDAAGPWDRDETLILMLRPGSTHWEQLELPNHYDYGARITAVRIG